MKKISFLLFVLFASVTILQAQESHCSYSYEGTTYRTESGGQTSMTNKASSCQLPLQFTVSILSGRKTAWLVSSSKTIRFTGDGVQSEGGYFFTEPADYEEMMSLALGAYENISVGLVLFIGKDYRSLIAISEEPTNSGNSYVRLDHYRFRGSVSAPNNPQRVEYERREANRVANERIAQQEAQERARAQEEQLARKRARLQATVNKPFPMANFRDTQGNLVESSYFSRGKKLLVVTTMVGCTPNRKLKKELEKYPQIASQVLYIHMVESEGPSRYKPNEPISQNKIYFNQNNPSNRDWVFGGVCPRIILLDEQGRVLAQLQGYDEKTGPAELKPLIDGMRRRTTGPYRVGDYYFDGEKEGVVFEVWNNGQSGKIVGLRRSQNILRWEEGSAQINFDKEFGELDGRLKRPIVSVAENRGLARYPAIRWCFNYGAGQRYYGWYLPRIEEWNAIWRNRSVIDPLLADKIGDAPYWTCCERGVDEAYYFGGGHGSLYSGSKGYGHYVRAVATFGSLPKKHRPKTTTGPYQVGDYYSENGKRGLVFQVSEDGYSGKIVSLNLGREEWCTVENIPGVGAFSELNGAENMEAIKQIPDWQTKFPAFKWCADQGEGWYLPAKEELLTIVRNKALLNLELSYPLFDKQWSSTEGIIVDPYKNSAESCSKSERNEFRAVCIFGLTTSSDSSKEITSAPYQVGDYYFDGEKEGVVFEIWDEGRSGKIVSLERGIAPWMPKWRVKESYSSNIRNASVCLHEMDGQKNMEIVKRIPDWQRNYPAMKWCADLGEGWYLPAIFELEQILLDSVTNSRIHATLRAKGAYGISVEVPGEVAYLSSTESPEYITDWITEMSVFWVKGKRIRGLNMKNGEQESACYLRAVSTFGDKPRPTTTLIREKSSGPYRVGDYYNDGVKDGIVIEVNSGGYHGKIISMRESLDAKKWSLFGEYGFGAESKRDGRKNMEAVMTRPDWMIAYPAFRWCALWGEGWYLPSIGEWLTIYKNKEKINAGLEDKLSAYYWTSVLCKNSRETYDRSTNKTGYAYDFDCREGRSSVELKFHRCRVRAMAQF